MQVERALSFGQGNSKHEIRNPKQIQMTQIPNPKQFGTLENWNLDIVSNFEFRISDFLARRARLVANELVTP